jgi:putative PIN family toxin of toxin-antitoxin system
MKKVVIDTNVLISSTLSPNGNPSKIMGMISDKELRLFYCSAILGEYKKVLAYERLNIASYTQTNTLRAIKRLGILIEPPTSAIPLPDETDRAFYDAAKEAGATLITGNIKHFPAEPFIMTPAAFLEAF